MEETPTLAELRAYTANLQAGASIIYSVLNQVYQLHDATENDTCAHCEVAYPCPTAEILLAHMVPATETENEETPAE